jgi:hypothetical protein
MDKVRNSSRLMLSNIHCDMINLIMIRNNSRVFLYGSVNRINNNLLHDTLLHFQMLIIFFFHVTGNNAPNTNG